MADYTQNQKVSGLDALPTPDAADLFVVGDVSDSSKAKKTTFTQLATALINLISTTLGGFVQSVTGLNVNNADPKNPIIQISVDGVTITGAGTPGSPLVATAGSGSGGGEFDGKVKSYSLEGLLGAPILNAYQNVECYLTVDGTTINAEFTQDFLQKRNFVADWAAADEVLSYVVNQGFLYLLLVDNATTAYRVYRYDITDITLGGTLMTIATQTLGTQTGVVMTSNGTDFFFNYQAGNSVNDYVISQYTIAGTTLTWSADITCGAVANATDLFSVFDNGDIYGYNLTTKTFKKFDNTGTLQDTFGPYDSAYDNLINWTETLYIVKSSGDDEAYRIQLETDAPGGTSQLKKVGVGNPGDIMWENIYIPFNAISVTARADVWNFTGGGSIVNPTVANLPPGNTVSVDMTNQADGFLPNFSTANGYGWDTPKQAIFKVVVKTEGGGGTNEGYIGFISVNTIPAQGSNTRSVGFIRDTGGQWYARTADNAAHTETAITISSGAVHVFRAEYDPANGTPQARFYVDGVKLATITTTLPSADTSLVGWGAKNAGGEAALSTVGVPTFAVEI